MITLKKIIAVLLCMIIAFGCFAVAAGAVVKDMPNRYSQEADKYQETAQEKLLNGDILGAFQCFMQSVYYRILAITIRA